MPIVTIIQRVLPHYRLAFFRRLRARLQTEGIEFQFIFGQEFPGTVPKTVHLGEPWATRIENRYIRVGNKVMVWQPCRRLLGSSDLVIFEQANALLLNHLLMLRRTYRRSPAIAFWGHGSNRQAADPKSLSERFKRRLASRVDWWFAYTELSARLVRNAGFPSERITVVNNTLDTSSLCDQIAAVTADRLAVVKRGLGLRPEDQVCLYIGGLYSDKRLDFLIQAGAAIHDSLPDFRLIVIGDGPDRAKVESAAGSYPWLGYLGPLFDADRAVYFKLARALLMPGAVGLAIIDSFASGLPLFTLETSLHGPEIDYLRHGENGFMTPGDLASYAAAVRAFLLSDSMQKRLGAACLKNSKTLSMQNMVDRYATGILQCLTCVKSAPSR